MACTVGLAFSDLTKGWQEQGGRILRIIKFKDTRGHGP